MKEELHKVGEGNTADIYAIDGNKVLKLFKLGYSQNAVWQEYQNHGMVNSMMNNVPQIYEYIEENGRFGYIMEKVQGKSFASLMMNELTFEPAMDMFTRIHKEWLTKISDTAILYTEWMKHALNNKRMDSDLLNRINHLPNGNTLCHGDFHPYNIIVTPENQPIVIDFANICRGPKEYDIARTYVLLKEAVADSPVAEIYLDKMQVQYRDLQEYIEVINGIREYGI